MKPEYNIDKLSEELTFTIIDHATKLNLLRDVCIDYELRIIKLELSILDLTNKVAMLVDLQKIKEL
jgi:hypothetical protein